ncbi:MAG: divergent polysaccharide deacetylase family protein [Rhodobacteraceae bacterium]|nr:divergent polysaccharide deacetylase family protein [Paracoccaceae bacterium]
MAQGVLAGVATGLVAGAAGLALLGAFVPPEAAGPPAARPTTETEAPAQADSMAPEPGEAVAAAPEDTESGESESGESAEAESPVGTDEQASGADLASGDMTRGNGNETAETVTMGEPAPQGAMADAASADAADTEAGDAGDAALRETATTALALPAGPPQPTAPAATTPAQAVAEPTRPTPEEAAAPIAALPTRPAAPEAVRLPTIPAPVPAGSGAGPADAGAAATAADIADRGAEHAAQEADATPGIALDTGTEGAAPTEATMPPGDTDGLPGNALRRNAMSFVSFDDRPLMAIVLIEAGEDGIAPDRLDDLPVPVTFALDPLRPDLEEVAAQLSQAGFELALLAPGDRPGGLSAEAGPEAVTATLGGWFARMPRAAALIDGPGDPLQVSQRLAEATIEMLTVSGHGLALRDRGLNTTARKAEGAEVPVALIFRALDSEREPPAVQSRYLDRAALKAREDGMVVMIGHSYPETIEALAGWALSARAQSVVLAPLSAVLLAEAARAAE